MPDITDASMNDDKQPGSLLRRLVWFVLLWAAGVVTVALVAYALKAWIT